MSKPNDFDRLTPDQLSWIMPACGVLLMILMVLRGCEVRVHIVSEPTATPTKVAK